MARLVLQGSILKKILITVSCMLASTCVQTPVAVAQHGGLHGPISRPRASAAPPVGAFRAGSLIADSGRNRIQSENFDDHTPSGNLNAEGCRLGSGS